jgi:hypothetical protein
LVMQLVDDGSPELDQPVQHYLPQPLPEYRAYRDLANDSRSRKLRPECCSATVVVFPTSAA